MKTSIKAKILLATCIVLALTMVSSLIAYGAITLTSNTVTIIPKASPTLTLIANSTTPYIGDTVHLTATISGSTQTGVAVYFFSNSTQVGVTTTTNGAATYDLPISNSATQVIQAQTTFTPP